MMVPEFLKVRCIGTKIPAPLSDKSRVATPNVHEILVEKSRQNLLCPECRPSMACKILEGRRHRNSLNG